MTDRPAPALIRSPAEAEEVAARWLRWLGFEDVRATGPGPDGGVDVRGRAMVAQVKMLMVKVGRPDLQRLHGIAANEKAVAVFFSLGGYTPEAKAWAEAARMALFRFSPVGEAEPVNAYASALTDRAAHQTSKPSGAQGLAAIPIGCSDNSAYKAVVKQRRGMRERLGWVYQGWIPTASLTYDYTHQVTRGRRSQELFAQRHIRCELVSGSTVPLPKTDRDLVRLEPERVNLRMRVDLDALSSRIQEARYLSDQREVFAIPSEAKTLRVSITGIVVIPIYVGLFQGPSGSRFAVAEGVEGTQHPGLSEVLTRLGMDLVAELKAGRLVTEGISGQNGSSGSADASGRAPL